MDSEVALNSARQTVAEIFRTMNGIRSSEQTIANGGTGYRFNTDGNQVTYRCDVRRVTTINYDRNVIRAELAGSTEPPMRCPQSSTSAWSHPRSITLPRLM